MKKCINLLLISFMLASPTFGAHQSIAQSGFRGLDTGGFEIGNGRGLDNGGFEIGNGREITEILNAMGAHSIVLYKDFDFEINGETTLASGFLANGNAKTTLELGVERDFEIPELDEYIVEGLKQNAGSVVTLGNLQGFRRDVFDSSTGNYLVDIELHLAEGSLLNLEIESTLAGMNEVQAIAGSVKVHIN